MSHRQDIQMTEMYQVFTPDTATSYIESLARDFQDRNITINQGWMLSCDSDGASQYRSFCFVPRGGCMSAVESLLDRQPNLEWRRYEVYEHIVTVATTGNIPQFLQSRPLRMMFLNPADHRSALMVFKPRNEEIVEVAQRKFEQIHNGRINWDWTIDKINKAAIFSWTIPDSVYSLDLPAYCLEPFSSGDYKMVTPANVLVTECRGSWRITLIVWENDIGRAKEAYDIDLPSYLDDQEDGSTFSAAEVALGVVVNKQTSPRNIWSSIRTLFQNEGSIDTLFEEIYTCPASGFDTSIGYVLSGR